jgi:hypothetical protein
MLATMHSPAIEPVYSRPDDHAERVFASAIWLILSAALLAYVYCFGRNLPYWEDWDLVPVLSGAHAFDLKWLFVQVLEHRYVLGKALLYLIWLASDGDFRLAMWINALLLIAITYVYLRAARSLRGRASFADAFFPLLLLHWGHNENLIFFVQLWFVLPLALFSIALVAIITGWWQERRGTAVLGLCVLLLPLNGAMGLLLAPPLIAWITLAAWIRRTTTVIAWPLLIAGATTLIFSGMYFVHYQAPAPTAALPHTLFDTLRAALEVLCVSFGPAGVVLWPYLAFAVAIVCATTALALMFLAVRNGPERLRIVGVIACLAAGGLLVLGIGYGRSGVSVGAGFVSRYSLLAAPLLCLVFLAAIVYGGRFCGRLVQMTLLICACSMIVPNMQSGLAYARNRDATADAMLADIAAGVPPAALAQRYSPAIYPNAEPMIARLEMMRAARVGPYKGVAGVAPSAWGPSCREIHVPTQVIGSNQVAFEGAGGRGLGDDPYIVYSLPEALKVCGIRLEYNVDSGETIVATQVFWKLSTAGEEFDGIRRNAMVKGGAGDQTSTFWVYGKIDQFRFDPDARPCNFRLIDVTLLVQD